MTKKDTPYYIIRARGILSILCFILLTLVACKEDKEDIKPYPALITELAELYTDATGHGVRFTTDGGQTYGVNTPLTNLRADTVYRVMLGYEVGEEDAGGYPTATLYTAESVPILLPAKSVFTNEHPTDVHAVWRGGDYLNLHLAPKTQGGTGTWGYHISGTEATSTGKMLWIRLRHDRGEEPEAYTIDVYTSLPLARFPDLAKGDSIALIINTYQGEKTWRFAY